MNLLQRVMGFKSYASMRRYICCSLGVHGPRVGPDGSAANVCGWGCGRVYNPNMWKDYLVTLKSGEQYEVQATNEYHAGSVVVFGLQSDGEVRIDGASGKPLHNVMVHRENIASIKLK